MLSLQNNVKIRTSVKPRKLYRSKDFVKSYPNIILVEFERLCQKLWAFMSNFGFFYHDHSPDMVKSCDSG